MAKVLWLGDAGTHTGFSQVTHHIGERLVDMGHEVVVLAVGYKGDSPDSFIRPGEQTNLRLFPTTAWNPKDVYGNTRILEMFSRFESDVVVMLNDPQIILSQLFENVYDQQRVLLQARPIIAYIPCDGDNLPPPWTEILPQVTNVVAMSEWGQSKYPGSQLVYHGVDPLYWPVAEKPITISSGEVLRSKRDCKRALNFDPDGFLVLRVDSNSGRKDMAATIRAVAPLMARHPDMQLHLHCDPGKLTAYGTNLKQMLTRFPEIDPAKRVYFPETVPLEGALGWKQQDLNALYNAADVFISTSRGEGFGLTIAEALACGVPVVAQNVSAIPEVVGPGGILIEPAAMLTVPSGEDVWLADVDGFTAALERLYQSAGLRRDLGAAGRRHAVESFSWDAAAARFDEFIVAAKKHSDSMPEEATSDGSRPDRHGDRNRGAKRHKR